MADTVSVTQEALDAYVAWEPPCELDVTKPARALGLIRAAFFAGWEARLASTQPAPAFPREEVRATALEEAAKIADAHRAGRLAAKQNALDRKQKSEARDHESMAIEAMHIATAIRAALLQGKQP